jgi:anti-sigma regulatory factor (Ser/Thr protein kinase)
MHSEGSRSANLYLSLSNTPENIPVVHQVLTRLAAALGLDALEANDLDTAVTEACNNVVHHAYDGQRGPLEVEVRALSGALEVVVRDRGLGIRPHLGERTQPHTGIGLPIIHALTRRVAFSKLTGGGTEVQMQFAAPAVIALEPPVHNRREYDLAGAARPSDAIEIALAPSLAPDVLPGVLGALADRACFSGDRTSELGAFADALAANAGERTGERHLRLLATVEPGGLQLSVGPLREGSAASLLESGAGAGLASSIERTGGEPAGGEPAGGEPAGGEPAAGEPAGGESTETLVLRLRDGS